jgi:hypothetical protein
MFLAGFSEENWCIRDNPPFTGNPLELPVNSQNNPIKASPGTLSPNSPKSHDNLFYRSFLAFKTWHIFLIFKPPFLGILADNPRKIAKYSPLKIVTAIPNVYP